MQKTDKKRSKPRRKKTRKPAKQRTIVDHFSAIKDPRRDRCKRHQLIGILVIRAACTRMCGKGLSSNRELDAKISLTSM